MLRACCGADSPHHAAAVMLFGLQGTASSLDSSQTAWSLDRCFEGSVAALLSLAKKSRRDGKRWSLGGPRGRGAGQGRPASARAHAYAGCGRHLAAP